MDEKLVTNGAMRRKQYPDAPRVGVGTVITRGEKVLLVKRKHQPSRGLWAIPGGLLEVGERLEHAAQRELQEETGLICEIDSLLDVFEIIQRDRNKRVRYHYVIVDFKAHVVGGRLKCSDEELFAAKWVPFTELEKYPLTPTTGMLLKKIHILK